MDIELFQRRLIETATWCQQYSEPQHRLRSPALRPDFPQGVEWGKTIEGEIFLFELSTHEAKQQVVDGVVERRAFLLQSQNLEATSLLEALPSGRLLAYTPNWTVWDGGAEGDTDGFYDVGDTPPWDTWVCCLEEKSGGYPASYVIAWIPRIYLDIADDGAQVTCGQCLKWLDELDTDFTRQLRAAKLLL